MFENRQEAGKLLAQKLRKIINPSADSGQGDFVVIALLRGGIVLGKKISDYFKIPLFPLSVKKIGAPLNNELAIGAVTFDRTYYFDEDIIRHLSIEKNYIKNSLEIKRKEAKVLQNKFPTSPLRFRSGLRGARVIIVDDGIATGTTAICASIYAKKQKAKEIILATPLIAKDSLRIIKTYFDRVVSLKIPSTLSSVSQFYKYFPQVADEEVIDFLV